MDDCTHIDLRGEIRAIGDRVAALEARQDETDRDLERLQMSVDTNGEVARVASQKLDGLAKNISTVREDIAEIRGKITIPAYLVGASAAIYAIRELLTIVA